MKSKSHLFLSKKVNRFLHDTPALIWNIHKHVRVWSNKHLYLPWNICCVTREQTHLLRWASWKLISQNPTLDQCARRQLYTGTIISFPREGWCVTVFPLSLKFYTPSLLPSKWKLKTIIYCKSRQAECVSTRASSQHIINSKGPISTAKMEFFTANTSEADTNTRHISAAVPTAQVV